MKVVIPEVKPMKGEEIPEYKPELEKFVKGEEKEKIMDALDKIVFAYYSVWFGYPVRNIKDIKKDLHDAKQELAQVKCPEVI